MSAPIVTTDWWLERVCKAVRSKTDAEKANIWACLNRFEWPPELAELKPAEYQEVASWEIMGLCMDDIGFKECLRAWNKESLPGEKFDEWWAARKSE